MRQWSEVPDQEVLEQVRERPHSQTYYLANCFEICDLDRRVRHMTTAKMRNRLKRLERQGLVRRSNRHGSEYSIAWVIC